MELTVKKVRMHLCYCNHVYALNNVSYELYIADEKFVCISGIYSLSLSLSTVTTLVCARRDEVNRDSGVAYCDRAQNIPDHETCFTLADLVDGEFFIRVSSVHYSTNTLFNTYS